MSVNYERPFVFIYSTPNLNDWFSIIINIVLFGTDSDENDTVTICIGWDLTKYRMDTVQFQILICTYLYNSYKLKSVQYHSTVQPQILIKMNMYSYSFGFQHVQLYTVYLIELSRYSSNFLYHVFVGRGIMQIGPDSNY
jgi:hypothetical protein